MDRMHRRLEAACGVPEGAYGDELWAAVSYVPAEFVRAMLGDLFEDAEDREHAFEVFPVMGAAVAASVASQGGDWRPAFGTLVQVFLVGVFYGEARERAS